MKKGIFILLFFSNLCNASNDLKTYTSSPITQQSNMINDELSSRYQVISGLNIIDSVNIDEQQRDMDIEENLINKNIKISLNNKTNKPLIITGINYYVNDLLCGYTKLNVNIPPSRTISDFLMDKAEGIRCLKKADEFIGKKYGRLSLIDLGSKFDVNKYQQFKAGLFLYPLIIKIIYTDKVNIVNRTQLVYLVYTAI